MPKYLTVRDVAEQLGVSENTVYGLCTSRRLRHVRIGGGGSRGTIRVGDDALDAYLASVTMGPSNPPTPIPAAARKTTIKHLNV